MGSKCGPSGTSKVNTCPCIPNGKNCSSGSSKASSSSSSNSFQMNRMKEINNTLALLKDRIAKNSNVISSIDQTATISKIGIPKTNLMSSTLGAGLSETNFTSKSSNSTTTSKNRNESQCCKRGNVSKNITKIAENRSTISNCSLSLVGANISKTRNLSTNNLSSVCRNQMLNTISESYLFGDEKLVLPSISRSRSLSPNSQTINTTGTSMKDASKLGSKKSLHIISGNSSISKNICRSTPNISISSAKSGSENGTIHSNMQVSKMDGKFKNSTALSTSTRSSQHIPSNSTCSKNSFKPNGTKATTVNLNQLQPGNDYSQNIEPTMNQGKSQIRITLNIDLESVSGNTG